MNDIAAGNFREALRIMVYGMLGIFLVLIVIYGAIKALIKIFPEKNKSR